MGLRRTWARPKTWICSRAAPGCEARLSSPDQSSESCASSSVNASSSACWISHSFHRGKNLQI